MCAIDLHSSWMGMLLPGKGMTTYNPKATKKKPTMKMFRSSALHVERKQVRIQLISENTRSRYVCPTVWAETYF